MQNPYQTLGVERTASSDDIKRAYRRLASQHHPDRGGDTKKFQEIQAAYDTLSDPQKRQQFDNPGFGGFRGDAPFDFQTIFDIFGTRFHAGPQQQRVQNIRMSLWITLRDVAQGGKRTVSVGTPQGVNAVEIEIPVGIDDGDQVQYNAIAPGGANLTVQFRIHPDGRWQRNGLTVITERTFDVWDLLLGVETTVEDVLGSKFSLKVPAGTQPGTVLRLRNQGLKNRHGQQGDLLIQIQTRLPETVSDELRQLIEKERGR